jgi:sarcosine oxidase subunit beta
MSRVLIIGAGIQGLLAALFLVERGLRDIWILDKTVPGAGASGRSGALLRSNYDNAAEARLAERSLEFYQGFAARFGGTGMVQTGLLVAYSHNDTLAAQVLAQTQRGWGVPISAVDPQAARHATPHLRTQDCGLILHQPSAGYCEPNDILSALLHTLSAQGVKLRLGCSVARLTTTAGRITGVDTNEGPIGADAVIVAAGIDAPKLIAPWYAVALIPQLTRVATFRPHEFDGGRFATVIDTIQQAWFRPVAGGAILVGSESGVRSGIDPQAVPLTAPEALVNSYRDVLATRFDVSRHAAPRGAWAGAFLLSPDARPVVGALPGVQGAFVMTGDSGGAFKTAPALAEAVAAQLMNQPVPLADIADLSPLRFAKTADTSVAQKPALTISR